MAHSFEDISTLAPIGLCEIRVLTGFSAAGKTLFAERLKLQHPNIEYFVEDNNYTRPNVFIRAISILFRQASWRMLDPVHAFYTAAQQTLFDDAIAAAVQGRAVLVDVCCGPPEDFFQLLTNAHNAARKADVKFEIDWITCQKSLRKKRLLKYRATAFDLHLGNDKDYFKLVRQIEKRLPDWRRSGLPIHVFSNNNDMNAPTADARPLAGSEVKNLPGIGSFAASEHIRVLNLDLKRPLKPRLEPL